MSDDLNQAWTDVEAGVILDKLRTAPTPVVEEITFRLVAGLSVPREVAKFLACVDLNAQGHLNAAIDTVQGSEAVFAGRMWGNLQAFLIRLMSKMPEDVRNMGLTELGDRETDKPKC